ARPPRPSGGGCRWGSATPRALCWQPVNLAAYRADAEEFVSSLDREYYLHFAGLQDEFDIEAIYERHAELFSRDNVERLREEGTRQLVEFAVHGLMGRDTKAEQASDVRGPVGDRPRRARGSDVGLPRGHRRGVRGAPHRTTRARAGLWVRAAAPLGLRLLLPGADAGPGIHGRPPAPESRADA